MKKTKHGDYEETVAIPTFMYRVYVVFTNDLIKSANGRFGSTNLVLAAEARAFHCGKDGHSYLFYKLGRRKDGTEEAAPGIIAHESYHAVHCMLTDWAGVKDLDEEVVAYHLTYLVDNIHDIKTKVEALHESGSVTQGKPSSLPRLQP